jgi:hypothetical protein
VNNERAKTLAEVFYRVGGAPDTLHIYIDGLVMVLGGKADRHLAVRDVLLKDHPGFEEARVGNLSVFVVPMDVGWDTSTKDFPPLMVATTKGYHDHRDQGSFSIEATLGLFTRVKQQMKHQ